MHGTWRYGARTRAAAGAVSRLALLVLAALASLPALAADPQDEEEVPPSRQAVIVLRSLAYDGNLKSRARGTIDIGVLYKKGHIRSEQSAVTMTKAFGAIASTQVAGLPIAVSRIAFAGADSLGKSIAGASVDLLYVCDGLDAELDAITQVTRRMKVLSVGRERQQVHQGLSLGVFQVDGRTMIVLNLQASRQEGVAFAADLLRLAAVIR
jgi:hypothetical protein